MRGWLSGTTHIGKNFRAIVGDFNAMEGWTVTRRFEALVAERELTSETKRIKDAMTKACRGKTALDV